MAKLTKSRKQDKGVHVITTEVRNAALEALDGEYTDANFQAWLDNDPGIAALRQERAERKVRNVARQAALAAKTKRKRVDTSKDWWHTTKTPGPSRIRVTLNRPLTPAEAEHLHDEVPNTSDTKIRVQDNRVWVEEHGSSSRGAYDAFALFLSREYVNVFPVAVRTFRELVEGPSSAGHTGWGVELERTT